jgi:hypothetical protein
MPAARTGRLSSRLLLTAALATAVATTLVGSFATLPDLRATDFPGFYAGGRILLSGQRAKLYDLATQETTLQSQGTPRGPYYAHPPFEALAFAVVSLLPFSWAYGLWMGVNFAALVLTAFAFRRAVPLAREGYWSLLALVFLPAIWSVSAGQDSALLLLGLAFGYALMEERPFLAGLLMSAIAIKFQYVLILGPLLLLMRRRRTVAGLAAGCLSLGILSLAVTGLQGLRGYYDFLRAFDTLPKLGDILSVRHMVNPRGFFFGLGMSPRWEIPADLAILGMAALCAWKAKKKPALAFAVAVTACIVGSHYAHLVDATILVLPFLIALNHANSMDRRGAWALRLSCAAAFILPVGLLLAGNAIWNRYMYWNFVPFLLFFVVLTYAALYHAHEIESHSSLRNEACEFPLTYN